MSDPDLRIWLREAAEAGELQSVDGAHQFAPVTVERLDDFPTVAESSESLIASVSRRWPSVSGS